MLIGSLSGAALLLLIGLALYLRPGRNIASDAPAEREVEEQLASMDPGEMRAEAVALLETARPWRASRVMRGYLERVRTPSADDLILAARAEAGRGAWPRVRTLLGEVPAPALERSEHGIGLYLLGRAHDEAGDASGAVEAYRAFLGLPAPDDALQDEKAAARLRLGLALLRAGDREAARRELQTSAEHAGEADTWLNLLEADALAQVGDTAAVRERVASFESGLLGLRAWRARVEAARRAGDPARARGLANEARAWAQTDATRAEFLTLAAEAAIEMGDTAAARAALRAAIDRSVASRHARRAAALLRRGEMSAADHLAVARVYGAQGLHEESLEGYRQWLESGLGTASERTAVRMEYANALFDAERYDEVEEALRPIAGRTPARFLRARAESYADDADAAVRIYLDLAEEFAGADTGRRALFLAAGVRHEEGELERARELYTQVVREHPGTSLMGLAMLRLAGIAFLEERYAEAARIWDDYRARYPRGSRVLQATYWSARAHEALGDSTAAASLFRAVRQSDRDSYYALLASRRLGEPFWPLPMGTSPEVGAAESRRVARWMQGVDLLRDAGFPAEASAEANRIAAEVGRDRQTRYALAEALAERGYTQSAIRIGLGLQGSGPPNPRLLRILYPFPYRRLIAAEAQEKGLDPFLAAALIRQESMFEARITSHAGARGLMQIMPATGRRLAEEVGMEDWDAELLYSPEINVDLGTRLLAQHVEAYDGSLPSVFSAYNAGPHRVERWQEFPEYGREELFMERIPFQETRDYVKILTRNRELYEGLYGAEDEAGAEHVRSGG